MTFLPGHSQHQVGYQDPSMIGGDTPSPPITPNTGGVVSFNQGNHLGLQDPSGTNAPAPITPLLAPTVTGDPTLGTGSFPWLQPWTGGYQAPMSGAENQALGQMGQWAGSGFGLGGAQDYLNQVMGGQWLNPNNPYFDQIQESGTTLKNTQDQRALQELQSRAAAGGNALSGGLMQQEGDYLRNSNASFDQMMAQLRANQYASERGYMQQAPGMTAQLANTGMSGLGQLMQMGSVPRNIQTGEMAGQYNDFLRQSGALQGAYQYPDQAAMALLNQGKYGQTYNPTTGDSAAAQLQNWINQMLGGGASGGGIDWGSLFGSIFGGSSQDAHPMHYDSSTNPFGAGASPFSYQDKNAYNTALTNEQHAAAQAQQPKYSGLTAGFGTAGLLMTLLKLMGAPTTSSKSRGGGTSGGGGGGGGNQGKSLWDYLFGKKPQSNAPKPGDPNFVGPEQPNPNDQGPLLNTQDPFATGASNPLDNPDVSGALDTGTFGTADSELGFDPSFGGQFGNDNFNTNDNFDYTNDNFDYGSVPDFSGDFGGGGGGDF